MRYKRNNCNYQLLLELPDFVVTVACENIVCKRYRCAHLSIVCHLYLSD